MKKTEHNPPRQIHSVSCCKCRQLSHWLSAKQSNMNITCFTFRSTAFLTDARFCLLPQSHSLHIYLSLCHPCTHIRLPPVFLLRPFSPPVICSPISPLSCLSFCFFQEANLFKKCALTFPFSQNCRQAVLVS